ncbi:MAG: alpha-ketoacid dehydrogenase subunit beta, partial [Candidatus Bathyarchaeota archaeon]|nr:alpha-ketoacid dehydrogenase subunit beta [Candidatus Bathyarchaeota archaeon]
DPRTLVPLDKETILQSVKKTGRLLIVEEDCKTCGVGAEISAIVAEEAIDYLESPIIRIAEPDTPIPFSPILENYVIPNEEAIIKGVEKILS